MSDLNECTFIGRLGADPEVKRSRDGKAIVNFRLAVSEQWRDKTSGERKERTTWVPVVIFSEGLAKIAEQYLRKGSRVFLRGAFNVREWEDKDGNKRTSTEIVLQGFNATLTMLDRPGGFEDSAPATRGRAAGGKRDDFSAAPMPAGDFDDEIPF